MSLSAYERQLMQHALGLDQSDRCYRNRYVASDVMPAWEALVLRGLAVRPPFNTRTSQVLYAVSDEGITALGVGLLPDDLEPSERYRTSQNDFTKQVSD